MWPFGERRNAAEPAVPADTRVYAIGDVHGRADLLRALRAKIVEDARRAPIARKVVVYLGDYVDRGHESRQVVDMLIDEPLDGFESVHLKGNHEAFMLGFLDDAAMGPPWFANGGLATLLSYGVGLGEGTRAGERAEFAHAAFRAALPARHKAFLEALPYLHVEGDYAFVHAGIRPGVALEKQSPQDLMWIRQEFLASSVRHPKMIVHGHSIHFTPEARPNRIGIDTGAYATGTLTCLVLERTKRDFLYTA
jgi:serine/threonine protein phosphatase 1